MRLIIGLIDRRRYSAEQQQNRCFIYANANNRLTLHALEQGDCWREPHTKKAIQEKYHGYRLNGVCVVVYRIYSFAHRCMGRVCNK